MGQHHCMITITRSMFKGLELFVKFFKSSCCCCDVLLFFVSSNASFSGVPGFSVKCKWMVNVCMWKSPWWRLYQRVSGTSMKFSQKRYDILRRWNCLHIEAQFHFRVKDTSQNRQTHKHHWIIETPHHNEDHQKWQLQFRWLGSYNQAGATGDDEQWRSPTRPH